MAFQRAQWHSGLTYKQTCEQCKTTVVYKDDVLDFRPWYADGFVYCPTCHKPLRHNEKYAIDNEPKNITLEKPLEENKGFGFCTQCGKAFGEGDKFCSNCGTKKA